MLALPMQHYGNQSFQMKLLSRHRLIMKVPRMIQHKEEESRCGESTINDDEISGNIKRRNQDVEKVV